MALYAMSLWRLTVSAEIVKSVYFPPLYNGEDGAVAPQIIEKSKKISVVEDAYYNYYYREDSASLKPSKKAYLGMIEAFEVVTEYVDAGYNDEIEFLGIKFVAFASTLNAFKAQINTKEIKKVYCNFKNQYPAWWKNKYLDGIGLAKRVYLWALKNNLLFVCRMIANYHSLSLKIKK